jgi:hypothetical protein
MTRICPQCAMYRAQVVLLKLRIEQLLLQIKKLVRRIEAVRGAMYRILNESRPFVMQKSGVPRAKYAYHKGRSEVAMEVLRLLRGD